MDYTTAHHVSKPLYRGTQFVWYIIGIIQIVLFFRFVLRFIGANTNAPFVDFMYDLAAPFVGPFQNVVSSPRIAGGVFDWNTLIAMLVYWILGGLIVRLLLMAKPISTAEAHQQLVKEENNL